MQNYSVSQKIEILTAVTKEYPKQLEKLWTQDEEKQLNKLEKSLL